MYLRVDDEYLALGDSDLHIAHFIGVSIAEPCIEWVVVGREECFNILQK